MDITAILITLAVVLVLASVFVSVEAIFPGDRLE